MGQCQQEQSLLPVCRTFLEHLTTLRQVITSFGTFWQNKVCVALSKRLNSRTRDNRSDDVLFHSRPLWNKEIKKIHVLIETP